ncbi:MAG: ligand-binding sensor domain-containing protein, partial [Bacteroidales bacterium]
MKKLICTFLLLSILQIITGRTNDSFIFKQISIDHGLTHSKVISIHRDLDGFLWVGTEDGLNRINQSMVKTYRFDYNDSIRGNHIHFISEDYNKNLWIGTDKGLLRYNRNTDDFEKTEFSQYIYTGCLSEKDQIIFKAYDHLFILKAGSPEFIKFPNNKLHHHTTNILRKDNDHLIITGFWQGVYECNLKSGHLRGISMNTSLACTSVTMDNNKNFWFGFYGSGLICCDQNLQYKTNILFNQESDSHDNLIMDLKADKEGLIWAITDGGGLKLLNPETYEYRSFEHTYGVKGSLPVNNLFTTYIDTNNNIWLGSISGGIIGVDKSKIQSFQEGISNSDYGLSHNIVSSFAKSENYIWIGTDGNGINRFNPQTNKFKHYANTFKLPISSIIDWNDQFLMTTFYNKGIYLFDKLKGEYFIIRELDKINNEIRNTQVSPGLYKLDDESIFIASTESYYYNFISKRLINLSKQDKVIHHPSIRLAGEDKHYLYLYDSNKIIIYNKLNKSLKQHTRFKLTELGHIKCMSFDQSSGFWFVTRRGLYNYNGKRLFYHKIPGINDPTSIIQIEKSIIGIGDKRKFIVYNSD